MLAAAGCVQPQWGSRIIADLDNLGPTATIMGLDGPLRNAHYELWATIEDAGVVRLLPFAVVPVVDPASPCLYYDETAQQAYGWAAPGEPIMAPIPASDPARVQADKTWLQSRVRNLASSVFAVATVSDGRAGATDIDPSKCQDGTCWLGHAAIVPGSFELRRQGAPLAQDACDPNDPSARPRAGRFCLQASSGRLVLGAGDSTGGLQASYRAHLRSPRPQTDPLTWPSAERLGACGAAGQPTLPGGAPNPDLDADFYIGNAIQLTAPRNGVLYGVVKALDPNAGLQLGGVHMVVRYNLRRMSELFVTVEDHNAGSPEPGIENPIDPLQRGPLVLFGHAERGRPQDGRGLLTVQLAAPARITFDGLTPGGHASVYVDLSEDEVQF